MDGQLRVVCYRLTRIRLMGLHEAVKKGDIEAVKQLMTGGVDVNAKNDFEINLMNEATGSNLEKGHSRATELARDAPIILSSISEFPACR